jgi:hypothetical protein
MADEIVGIADVLATGPLYWYLADSVLLFETGN